MKIVLSLSFRIQDLDGGFFEKFGSLLRQKSVYDEERLVTPLAPLPAPFEEELADEEPVEVRSMNFFETENDSGRETLHDTDSEPEDAQSVLGQLIEDAFGWNVRKNDSWGRIFNWRKGSKNRNRIKIRSTVQPF